MHILLLTYEFYPSNGGVGNATLSLARAFREHLGAKASVVVGGTWYDWQEAKDAEEWEEMSIRRIKYTGIPEDRFFRQSVRSAIFFIRLFFTVRKLSPDVIIAQRVFDLGLFGGVLGRLFGCRTIAYAHGPDEIGHADILKHRRILNRLAGKITDAVVATNTHHAKYLEENIGRPVSVIPNIAALSHSIDRSESRMKLGLTDNLYHILFVGRLCKEYNVETKGLSSLLKAMPSLPNTLLHVIGEGPLLSWHRQLTEELNITSRVRFHGVRSHEEVNDFMCASDALVAPSIFEGCSLTVLEAMKLGLLVLATPVGGLLDLVRDGETGLTIRVSDPDSIAAQVRRAQSDKELRRTLTENARSMVNESFSSSAVAERFRPLLE